MGSRLGVPNRKIRLDGAIRTAKISGALRANPRLSNADLARLLDMKPGSVTITAARVRRKLGISDHRCPACGQALESENTF